MHNNLGTILVLFILLVIIACSCNRRHHDNY
ncbi:sporulation protein YjcZ [Bacillus sp. FJAT-28004]|nr:sporulation protein YjcZ [Bacillus sp. FJAT-28004]